MTIAAKHLDPLVGLDIHIILIPTPVGPVPTPLPHPYIGMLLDPMDYVPVMGATTYINGLPRGQAGSSGMALPPHIPMGGPFAKPPSNESEMFMGSATVVVDGEPQSFLGLPVLSCQDIGMPAPPRPKKKSVAKSLMLPTTVVLSIPMGMLVLIGGPPTISMMAMAMKLGMAGLKKLFGKLKKLRKKLKRKNKKCTRPGHPINPVNGANCEETLDYAAPDGNLRWERYYDSSRCTQQTQLGRGFRHSFDWELRVDRAGAVLTTAEGEPVEFPRTLGEPLGGEVDGFVLSSVDPRRFLVKWGKEVFHFEKRKPTERRALLTRREVEGGSFDIVSDPQGRIVNIVEFTATERYVTFILYDDRGRITQLQRGPVGQPPQPIAAYRYDTNDCLREWMDAHGHLSKFAYDADGRVTAATDRNGYTFSFRYDDLGRCVEEHGQDGLWQVKLRYEPNKTIVTEADGFDWEYLFDDNQTVVAIVDPSGGADQNVVDGEGRVVAEIDPAGRETEWLYDDTGYLLARRDPWQNLLPPADAAPNPPDPLDHVVPDTHLLQQWGLLVPQPDPAAPRSLLHAAPPAVQAVAQRLLPAQAAAGASTARSFDAQGNCISETDVLGRTRRWQYDAEGNVVAYFDRDGRVHRRQISSWNLLEAEIDPLGSVTRYAYTPREEISEVTDPNGNVSRFEYDFRDRLTKVFRYGALREEYSHSPGDEVLEKRDGSGTPLVSYDIGPLGLHAGCKLASGESFLYAYDEFGQFINASSSLHDVELETDSLDQQVLDERDGKGVHHLYAFSDWLSTAYLGSFSTGYRRLGPSTLEIRSPEGSRHTVRWDSSGLVLRQLANGSSELSAYDLDERCVARVSWKTEDGDTVLRSFGCAYSGEGELTRLEDSERGATLYEYDAAHRLIAEQPAGAARAAIGYDRGGNLLELPGSGALGYLPDNRLGVAGLDRFEHDERQRIAKRLTVSGSSIEFKYDSLDMLVELLRSDRAEVFRAGYDGLGRRIFKEYGGKRTEFYWDGDRLAAEIAPNQRIRLYVYASPDALVPFMFVEYENATTERERGLPYYVFTNQIGLPIRIEDGSGATVWQVEHADAYGSMKLDPSSLIEFALRWPGHYFDAETGLHCNRYRYYCPELGRYLQPDPLGFAGGTNLYAYPPNPLVDVDILGLHKGRAAKGKSKASKKKKPPKEKLKAGEVDSYRNQNKKKAGRFDRDHVPAFNSVLEKVNKERAKMKPRQPPLTPKQAEKLKQNLTTVAIPRKVHKKGRTYGNKGGQARVDKDGENLRKAAADDMAEHRGKLKKAGHSDEEIDAWEDAVHKRNTEQGVYKNPTNPDLYL